MNMWKRIFITVLAVGILVIPSVTSYAAESEAYTYTVSFSSGNQGLFEDGTDKEVHKDLPAGTKVSFTAQEAVTLAKDSKYYVKGVRLSGRDNSEAEMATLTVEVTKDLDYVVVYGIKGNQVSYTVNYQDEAGNTLADKEVFYGNVGDKPVIAYKYIEGYAPKMLGLTKTLSENEAENIFTFVYTKTAEEDGGVIYVEGGTTIVYQDIVTTIVNSGNGSGAGTGAGTGTATGADGGAADQDAAGNEEEGQGTSEGENDLAGLSGDEEPQEIVDLDDEETPLGNIDLDDNKDSLSMTGLIALVAVCVVALIALIILLLRIRKRNKKEQESERNE